MGAVFLFELDAELCKEGNSCSESVVAISLFKISVESRQTPRASWEGNYGKGKTVIGVCTTRTACVGMSATM